MNLFWLWGETSLLRKPFNSSFIGLELLRLHKCRPLIFAQGSELGDNRINTLNQIKASERHILRIHVSLKVVFRADGSIVQQEVPSVSVWPRRANSGSSEDSECKGERERAHYDNRTQARELFNEIKNNLINLTVTHAAPPPPPPWNAGGEEENCRGKKDFGTAENYFA